MGLVAALAAGISAGGAIGGGIQARRMADVEGQQYDVAAGQQIAASQRTAMEQQRQSRLAQSRALAVAAASGGGASDVTVEHVIANIAGEGAYRSAVALFDGEEKARSLRMKGWAARETGASKERAGYIQGVSSLLSSGTSLYGKYAQGGYSSAGYGSIDATSAGVGLDGASALPY
jgi:hypothetical protein